MPEFELKLRRTSHPAHPLCAWYLTGGELQAWVQEIVTWHVCHASLQLLALPRGAGDRMPQGILVVGDGLLSVRPRIPCMPFARLGTRLFLPTDAELVPRVSLSDLDLLLAPNARYVWHPVMGLVRFEANDHYGLADLIAAMRFEDEDWSCAKDGISFPDRISYLGAAAVPEIDDLVEAMRDDVGRDAGLVSQLPPRPREPSNGWLVSSARELMRRTSVALKLLIERMTGIRSVKASGQRNSTRISSHDDRGRNRWLRRWHASIESRLAGIAAQMRASQNREVERLLHLLAVDPDRGLRFALPLAGMAPRGVTPPSARLRERKLQFGVRGTAGPADIWLLDSEYCQQLRLRYRELANREIALGRHRRAAYIFAELLGDHAQAAEALTTGGWFREAAIVYRKRLARPHDAASCLKRGGYFNEAIEIYVEIKEFEQAGMLWKQLDQTERAHAMFQAAVGNHLANSQFIQAARIQEKLLGDCEAALITLARAWPHHGEAMSAFQEVVRIHQTRNQHEETAAWLRHAANSSKTSDLDLALTRGLARLGTTYPHGPTRELARECAYERVSHYLQKSDLYAPPWLDCLRALAPHDRLLDRDCYRYRQLRARASVPQAATPAVSLAPRLVRTIQLLEGVNWLTAIATGSWILSVGHVSERVVVQRCDWDGYASGAMWWNAAHQQAKVPILTAYDPTIPERAHIHFVGGNPLVVRVLSGKTDTTDRTEVGGFAGMKPQTVGIAMQGDIDYCVDLEENSLLLSSHRRNGGLLATRTLSCPPVPSRDTDPDTGNESLFSALACRGHGITRSARMILALDRYIGIARNEKDVEWEEMPMRIYSWALSFPHTNLRVAVGLQSGAILMVEGLGNMQTIPFATNLSFPYVSITRGGVIVAADAHACEIYGVENRKITRMARGGSDRNIVGLVSGPHASRFGIVTREGRILIFER